MRDVDKNPRKMKYKSKMTSNAPYYNALLKMEKKDIINLLLEFKTNIIKEIKQGERLPYSTRKLFTALSIRAGVLT